VGGFTTMTDEGTGLAALNKRFAGPMAKPNMATPLLP